MAISALTLTIEFEYLTFKSEYLQALEEIKYNQDTTELTLDKEEVLDQLNLDEMQIVFDFEESIPIYLTKNDGEIITLTKTTSDGFNSSSSEYTTKNLSVHFDEIISLDEIYSVTFGDITVTL